ncbi:HU family DNA-binding protein [uncultured Parabacteroides sp.]|uniref:HU family DNA-binding protein n=1 Tax=uncultured Parabacteroides sp. TaxID=512312 RepID=UPI00259157A1|nr:HU family DNA-binding protein [uncultured Parabacteroides sp.]
MNKQELIRQLAGETGFHERQVRMTLDCLIRKTMEALANDQSLVLQTLGTFRSVWQTERPGRNPKTGEPKTVPSRFTVKFRPGNAFLKALNDNK